MRTSWCTRPSKLRLPESTEATDSLWSLIAFEIGGIERAGVADAGRAAVADDVEAERLEVVHQSPSAYRYSVTTFEPGASEVLTQGCTDRPRWRAFRATSAGADHHRRDSRCWCRR